jgi:hypothetical protein
MIIKTELRYLFVAVFTDGSNILQTPEDVSIRDSSKSAYYDVEKAIESGKEIASFGLFNDEHTWAVSLLDGHFEVDEILFSAQPTSGHKPDGSADYVPVGGSFKLLFFRDHQQDIIKKADGTEEMGENRHAYRFGWEYEIEGRIWQQTIVVQ